MFGFFKRHKQENADGTQAESEAGELADGEQMGEAQVTGIEPANAMQGNENFGDGTSMNNVIEGENAAGGVEGENADETAEGGATAAVAGTVEKIKLSDVNGLKAEMKFDEEIERIKNDKQFLMECYRYVRAHADELKKLLGVDEIKFDE